jgi:hypothetical protein
MKKYLILFIASLISFNLSAQCLGEDCSIKGRNQARKQKSAKMTGKRSGNGSLYSIEEAKKQNVKEVVLLKALILLLRREEKVLMLEALTPLPTMIKKIKKGKKGVPDMILLPQTIKKENTKDELRPEGTILLMRKEIKNVAKPEQEDMIPLPIILIHEIRVKIPEEHGLPAMENVN